MLCCGVLCYAMLCYAIVGFGRVVEFVFVLPWQPDDDDDDDVYWNYLFSCSLVAHMLFFFIVFFSCFFSSLFAGRSVTSP